MSATIPNPTLSGVYTVLGAAISSWLGLGAGQVVQGFGNRVAMPPSGPFVVMYAMLNTRLATNEDDYGLGTDDPTTQTTKIQMQVSVQLDVYGPTAGDFAVTLTGYLRDEIGCDALAPTCAPLYSDDPRRAPLTNAEEQYEDKWIVTAQIAYDPVLTAPLQSADALGPVNVVSVDATYPPG